MKYKILTTDPNRWGEKWQYGDIVAIDDDAAYTPLLNGEIEEFTEEQAKKEIEELEEVEEVKSIALEEGGTHGFKCEVCGKICKNKLGFNAHMRSHGKSSN